MAVVVRNSDRGCIAMEPIVYEPDGPTCAARMIGYVAGLLETCA